MSVRTQAGPSTFPGGSRLQSVLGIGLQARPRPPSEVYTSDGTLIGYATQAAEGYVFSSPDQLRGVRVHPPFRVATEPEAAGIVAGMVEVLSGALGR